MTFLRSSLQWKISRRHSIEAAFFTPAVWKTAITASQKAGNRIMHRFRNFSSVFKKSYIRLTVNMSKVKGKLWHKTWKTQMRFIHLKLHSISHFQYYANVILGMKCLQGQRDWKKKVIPYEQKHMECTMWKDQVTGGTRGYHYCKQKYVPIRLLIWFLHGLICSTQRRKQTISKWIFTENVLNFMFSLKHDRGPKFARRRQSITESEK